MFVREEVSIKEVSGTANEKNLRAPSASEARERGKKGGKASAKSRAARKALRDELLELLSLGDTQKKLSLALIEKASQGDVKAFIAIRDTVGEKPIDKIITTEADPSVIAEIEKMVNNDQDASG